MAAANKRRFTDQMLERIRSPTSGRIELGDEIVPGLVLRVTTSGVKSFSVIYKVPGEGGVSATGRLLAGRQHRITLGQYPLLGLAQAREKARELLGTVSEGRDPRPERREANLLRHTNTVETVAKRFIEQDAKRTVASWQNIERVLDLHVVPRLGSTPIRDVRRADVHALLDELVAADKVGTAREVRKHLSRLFNWAVDRELLTDSPVHGLKRGDLDPNAEAGRALTNDELRHIWRAAGGLGYPFGPWYQLLILTGRRRDEWAAARRSEIDAPNRLHELPKERHKSRRGHALPLSEPAWTIFDSLPVWAGDDENKPNDYYLLSTNGGEGHIKGFSKAKTRLDAAALKLMRKGNPEAALAPYRVHDFRVTCETRLADLGFNQDVRDAVLGHAKPGLQKTYNKHEYLEEKREAMAAYGAHIMGLVK